MLLPYLPISCARPVVVYSSSLRRLAGLPLRLFFHNIMVSSGYLVFCWRAPAHVHFRLFTCSIMSVTFVFSLTHMFVYLSRYVILSILLSICVCAAASLFFAWVVSAHVSTPSVIAESMRWRVSSSILIPMFLLKMCMANAVHPAVILLWISLSCLSLVLYLWPMIRIIISSEYVWPVARWMFNKKTLKFSYKSHKQFCNEVALNLPPIFFGFPLTQWWPSFSNLI